MLYFLWDLGLKVGHATRSIDDCLAEGAKDTTIRTSLLDARLLAGDSALFDDFHERFRAACKEAGAAEYIAAKQAERDVRHRRYGDSPFVVEPNIKEGRGGLRDLQTLYWIARYVFDTHSHGRADGRRPGGVLITETEARHARRSWDFLWTVRFHLHYVAGRAEERLTFDLQPVVGARMGYTRHGRQDGVERFMRHYFLTAREVARLTRVLEPALMRAALGPPALARGDRRALLEAGFVLADGKLLPVDGARLRTTSRSRCCASCRSRATATWRCIRWPALVDPQRTPRRDAARRSEAAAICSSTCCAAASRTPRQHRGPRRRRALAGDAERDRLPRPLPARLGAHRRADAVRHLPRVHRRRAHDRGGPRAERAGTRRACRGRAGRLRPGGSSAVAPRALSWRCCCTTSPRAAAAIIPSSAPRSRWRSGPRWA